MKPITLQPFVLQGVVHHFLVMIKYHIFSAHDYRSHIFNINQHY